MRCQLECLVCILGFVSSTQARAVDRNGRLGRRGILGELVNALGGRHEGGGHGGGAKVNEVRTLTVTQTMVVRQTAPVEVNTVAVSAAQPPPLAGQAGGVANGAALSAAATVTVTETQLATMTLPCAAGQVSAISALNPAVPAPIVSSGGAAAAGAAVGPAQQGPNGLGIPTGGVGVTAVSVGAEAQATAASLFGGQGGAPAATVAANTVASVASLAPIAANPNTVASVASLAPIAANPNTVQPLPEASASALQPLGATTLGALSTLPAAGAVPTAGIGQPATLGALGNTLTAAAPGITDAPVAVNPAEASVDLSGLTLNSVVTLGNLVEQNAVQSQ